MSAESEKELQQMKKRFRELADKCYMQNVYCFTDFLGMAELDVFYGMERELSHVPSRVYGGGVCSERQMVRFGSEEMLGYDLPFPIACLYIRPLSEKFADRLTHRDFLGACMHLGIERSTLGDIVTEVSGAYLYCVERIAPYIMEHLVKIKHTSVTCGLCGEEIKPPQPCLERREYQVSSERLDGVIARAMGLSREKSTLLFRERRVSVNGRLQEQASCTPRKGDIISVRGHGKFVYHGLSHMTRKGKCNIVVEFYV